MSTTQLRIVRSDLCYDKKEKEEEASDSGRHGVKDCEKASIDTEVRAVSVALNLCLETRLSAFIDKRETGPAMDHTGEKLTRGTFCFDSDSGEYRFWLLSGRRKESRKHQVPFGGSPWCCRSRLSKIIIPAETKPRKHT